MLDADRALKFARAAGGALKYRLLRKMLAEQWFFGDGAEVIQIVANAERNFLGVENFAGVRGGAMLRAAAAFDARISLERNDARQILAGIESEIFVPGERRNVRELTARKKHRERTQHQVQMLGLGNQR